MTIKVKCPACDEPYRLADDKAGKDVRCKRCNETISVPDPEEERRSARQPKPKESGSSTMLYVILGVGGGFLLLVLLLCGAIGYFVYSAANAAKRGIDAVNEAAQDFPVAQPKDVNEALQWLGAGGIKAENAAAWLEKQPPDPARRAQVIAALDRTYNSATVNNPFAQDKYLNAMAAWAGPNDVPVLVKTLDFSFNPKVLDALVKYKNDEAARGVAKHLDGITMFDAEKVLRRMGSTAEDAVADYMLEKPVSTPTYVAARILKDIGTQKTVPKVRQAMARDQSLKFDCEAAIAEMQKRR
jgi:predicted Zn finger-like uncharacterized protein